MTARPVTRTQAFLAQLALALLVGLAVAGFAWNGFGADVRERFWQSLLDRPGGPMTFRFVLQPTMAAVMAFIDGLRDARSCASPYLASLLAGSANRSAQLYEGVVSTSRIILLGVAMDIVYQVIEFKTLYPGEAAVIAILLAFVPYLLLRGPLARLASWWIGAGRKS